MPNLTHTVSVDYQPSFRSEAIAGMFDVPPSEKLTKTWEVNLPIEDMPWQIGLIAGPSGSGKTTLAKRLFGDKAYHRGYDWTGQHVVDDFPENASVREITTALSHVGFSSPPDWQKPYGVLSNGQQFRAEIARLMLDDSRELVVVDEFTSVVDRQVARFSSEAVQKYIRRGKKQFVAVSCHYDILEWLRPDWVYHVDTGTFQDTRGLLRRPEIHITVQRVHHSAWRIFRGHHYLSADINTSAHCYVASIGDLPVAFAAALKFPHPDRKDIWRGHRTVVLPDYQGLGIGMKLSDLIGEHYYRQGFCYRSTTSHPAMIEYRKKSPHWRLTRNPGRVGRPAKSAKVCGQSMDRLTAAFEYVGGEGNAE